jgi:CubicO group peptidase (beta-lactamase class C family)
MKVRQLLLIVMILLASCAQSSIEERITRVESGLLSDYSGSSSQGMHILDRMQHYNVPGVSIVVINDFQIEWVKGYGVLAAGGNEPVTPQTLFQAGLHRKTISLCSCPAAG